MTRTEVLGARRWGATTQTVPNLRQSTKKRPPGLPPRIPTAALRAIMVVYLVAARTPAA